MEIKIDLNEPKILGKVTSDKFGLFVSNEWKRLIDPYTPFDTGMLLQNVQKLPFALHYKEIYAHYIYMGEVYVDPDYKVGGFYDPTYGWWSRPGVQKVASGRSFKNFNKNHNPKATDHWDEVAAENGQLDKLYRTLNNALQSGRF
jgi:hypothetical protein